MSIYILFLTNFLCTYDKTSNAQVYEVVLILFGLLLAVPYWCVPRESTPSFKKRVSLALFIGVISQIATLCLIPWTDWISILILTGCNFFGAGIIAIQGRYKSLDYVINEDGSAQR